MVILDGHLSLLRFKLGEIVCKDKNRTKTQYRKVLAFITNLFLPSSLSFFAPFLQMPSVFFTPSSFLAS